MNWRKIGQGLIGAFLNGAASSVTVVIVDPTTFNLFQGGGVKLAQVALVSGILGAALWLKQHPVEDDAQTVSVPRP